MAKILVTGGTGYIGSHTVVELQNSGYEVVIVDDLSNSNIQVLDRIEKITGIRPVFENIDCADYLAMDKLFEKYNKDKEDNIKAIIHFAASKAVGESVEKPMMYYRNNLGSLMNLLQLMFIYNVKNIVFSSSCTVYGQPDILPVTEAAPIKQPLSPYGNTKKIGEEIIHDAIYANPNYKGIILRYFNPIGAHHSAEIGELPNGIPNNLLPFVAQTAIGLLNQLQVYGDDYNTPDGSCIRDYINVVDLAKAHVLAVKRILGSESKSPIETFNLGTGQGLSVLEVIKTFEQVTGVKVPYRIVGRREGDIEQVWADPSYANKVLGWTAMETVEETLRSAWAWEQKLQSNRINQQN